MMPCGQSPPRITLDDNESELRTLGVDYFPAGPVETVSITPGHAAASQANKHPSRVCLLLLSD